MTAEQMLKDKRFYKFLFPSLIGGFLFVTPINRGGSLTIPIAVAANALLDLMGANTLTIIWLLISLSALVTLVHKTAGIGLLKKNEKLVYRGNIDRIIGHKDDPDAEIEIIGAKRGFYKVSCD